MTILKITFLDHLEEEHSISFKLTTSDISLRWQRIVNNNKSASKYLHSVLMNSVYAQIPKLHAELQNVVVNLNKLYDRPLVTYTDSILTKSQLNILHEQFELYGDRIPELQKLRMLSNNIVNDELHMEFCKLNELIHKYEDALNNTPDRWPAMSVLTDYYPADIYEPLKEQDKLYLESDFKWGSLYLGYNTLGKDWAGVCSSNDIDVILRDQVRIQQRFAAENWIYFGRDFDDFERIEKFENWYLNLPQNVQEKVPVDNLNHLSFGRLRVGSIIIDEYFLNYNNNLDHWKIPNSTAKLKWSKEIFSTFIKVVKFDFYE